MTGIGTPGSRLTLRRRGAKMSRLQYSGGESRPCRTRQHKGEVFWRKRSTHHQVCKTIMIKDVGSHLGFDRKPICSKADCDFLNGLRYLFQQCRKCRHLRPDDIEYSEPCPFLFHANHHVQLRNIVQWTTPLVET